MHTRQRRYNTPKLGPTPQPRSRSEIRTIECFSLVRTYSASITWLLQKQLPFSDCGTFDYSKGHPKVRTHKPFKTKRIYHFTVLLHLYSAEWSKELLDCDWRKCCRMFSAKSFGIRLSKRSVSTASSSARAFTIFSSAFITRDETSPVMYLHSKHTDGQKGALRAWTFLNEHF